MKMLQIEPVGVHSRAPLTAQLHKKLVLLSSKDSELIKPCFLFLKALLSSAFKNKKQGFN